MADSVQRKPGEAPGNAPSDAPSDAPRCDVEAPHRDADSLSGHIGQNIESIVATI